MHSSEYNTHIYLTYVTPFKIFGYAQQNYSYRTRYLIIYLWLLTVVPYVVFLSVVDCK